MLQASAPHTQPPLKAVFDPIVPLLFFRRNCQSEYRGLPLPGHVNSPHVFVIGEIKGTAVLTTVYLAVPTPKLLDVAALTLEHVVSVVPPLQMSPAELSLGIFLVAGALPELFQLDLVMRKLLRSHG
jgi:hypothetical protein